MPRTPSAAALTRLMLDLFRFNSLAVTAGDRLVATLGLTSARWQMLGAIVAAERPQPVAWLARDLGANRQNVQDHQRSGTHGARRFRPEPPSQAGAARRLDGQGPARLSVGDGATGTLGERAGGGRRNQGPRNRTPGDPDAAPETRRRRGVDGRDSGTGLPQVIAMIARDGQPNMTARAHQARTDRATTTGMATAARREPGCLWRMSGPVWNMISPRLVS